MIGIPPTILGVLFVPIYLTLAVAADFLRGPGALRRRICPPIRWPLFEGTDPGEIIYFKRKLGLPYVEFPPPRPPRRARSRAA